MEIRLEERVFLEEDFIFFIRNKENIKLGFVCFFVYEDYIEITNLFIRRKYRKNGIAKKTLIELKKIWKEKHSSIPLRLVPNPCDQNHNGLEIDILKQFYNNAGFFEIRKRDENDMLFFELKENF